MKRNGRLIKRIVTQESVNRYCEWLYGCEKSSGTIKQYKYYLILFMQYMNGKSVEKSDVIMWKGILRENGSGNGQQCTGSSQWIFDA